MVFFMPKRRQPIEIWRVTRQKVLERDDYQCQRCKIAVTEETAHIDHIKSGKLGGNEMRNLRTLCRKCHVLRNDHRHRGMISKALKDGIIDAYWRSQLWD